MSALASKSSLRTALWLPWRPGPHGDHDGEVVISLTEFRAAHARDLPAIYLAGLRLREGWYAMSGAVGMWLWGDPLHLRGGSLTIWREHSDLRRFVVLPAHVAIMRRYRDRGRIEANTWRLERCELAQIKQQAAARLTGMNFIQKNG